MKKLSILCGMFLMVALMTGQAFPTAYQIDIGQNGIDTGGTVNLFGQTGVNVDISVNGYACAPTDDIFGVQTYVEVDESLVDVTACTPLAANGCDLSLSGCTSPQANVWSLICSNFNFITNTGGALTFGTLTVDCVGNGTTVMTVANDISAMDPSYGSYNDGFLADCNLASEYPTTATVTIEQLPPPCACSITGEAEFDASSTVETTKQYTASQVVGTDCAETPVYAYSLGTGCELSGATINPATGLLTVPVYTGTSVNCEVCATDTANTGVDPCCIDIQINGGSTCDGEIYLGGTLGECDCVEEPPVDDPPYNRPGRRGLSLTCGDLVDLCACYDCEGDVDTSWSIVCSKPGLADIVEGTECSARVTVNDVLCDYLAEVGECTVTVTDPVNNWSDSIVLQIGEISVDLSQETVSPDTDSVAVDISVTNNSNTIRAMDITIDEVAGDDLVCTSCVADPDRALGFTCTAAEQPDGSCRVVLFSPVSYIREGEGVVATVIYDVAGGECVDCVELAITAIEAADQFNEDLCTCTDTGEVCFDVCGDIFPRDCLDPDCAPCGDGVVDLFDILEMVDIILAIDGYTATACQLDNGDVPNGMPPYCGNPGGTTNCLTDGEITIFDLMVIIDMALGKANCCDYCTSGSIF